MNNNRKEFKTIEEQKLYLINNKNIIDEEDIIKVLYERPYASIINPYKKFFYTNVNNNVHSYEKTTAINDYYKLATLDDLIANELHYYIGVFERRVKGAFAYIISKKMNAIGDDTATMYIDIFANLDDRLEDFKLMGFNDYKYSYDRSMNELVEVSEQTQDYRKKLLESITNINDNKKKKNNLFQKYIENNIPIPFWLVVHTLALGDILSIYQMLGAELRNDILKYLNNNLVDHIYMDTIFKLEEDLNIIKEMRNVINHYEPLYEFIRSKPKRKIRFGVNRLTVYSQKSANISIENLLENLPEFKNNDNNNTVEIYTEILEKIKKRDD